MIEAYRKWSNSSAHIDPLLGQLTKAIVRRGCSDGGNIVHEWPLAPGVQCDAVGPTLRFNHYKYKATNPALHVSFLIFAAHTWYTPPVSEDEPAPPCTQAWADHIHKYRMPRVAEFTQDWPELPAGIDETHPKEGYLDRADRRGGRRFDPKPDDRNSQNPIRIRFVVQYQWAA